MNVLFMILLGKDERNGEKIIVFLFFPEKHSGEKVDGKTDQHQHRKLFQLNFAGKLRKIGTNDNFENLG